MCDLLCATPAATGGPMLFAKNSDRPAAEPQVWEWHPAGVEAAQQATHVALRWSGEPALARYGVFGSRPTWGWGMEHGVNELGVAAGNATIYTTRDPRQAPDGLTGMDIVRIVLERCRHAAEAVDLIRWLLSEVGQGGSGHEGLRRPYWSSFLIADPREAYLVETSGPDLAVERVEDVRATSNRTTIPVFDAQHRHPRQPVERLVDPRLDASRRVLAERPVTVERLQRHLASHEGGPDGWTVCMHVDAPDHQEATTSSMVADLRPGAFPVVHHTVGSPCRATWETTDLADVVHG
jgi:hypothetical protein